MFNKKSVMSFKKTFQFSLVLFIVMILSILFFDKPIAIWINQHLASTKPLFQNITTCAEIITGFSISKYLIFFLCMTVGGIIHLIRKSYQFAKGFYFAGVTFFVCRLSAGMLKNVFLRLRPSTLFDGSHDGGAFFLNGSSFPSGHAAHFWGFVIPLVLLFPGMRYILIIPVLISLSRVMVNDHFVSDILGSMILCVVISSFLHWLMIKRSTANDDR